MVLPWALDDIQSKYTDADQPFDQCQAPPDCAEGSSELRLLVHDHPPFRAALEANVIEIRDQFLAGLTERLEAWCAMVRPYFIADRFQYQGAVEFDADCLAIAQHIQGRSAYLDAYLSPLTQEGTAPIAHRLSLIVVVNDQRRGHLTPPKGTEDPTPFPVGSTG